MPRKKENFIKCVYLIGFRNNGKVYIGSTVRWPYRQQEHLTDLEQGIHHNRYLQRAYVKYGKDNVYIEVLGEYQCSPAELLFHEEEWIKKYDSANPDKGFNSVPFPSLMGTSGYIADDEHRECLRRIGRKRFRDPKKREQLCARMVDSMKKHPERWKNSPFKIMTYQLYNPNGKLVVINNLHQFCRRKGLEYSKMREVAVDKRIEYMGWKKTLDRQHRRMNHYNLIGPNGRHVQGTGLRKFCLSKGLHYRSFCALLRGELKTCCGYRRADMDEHTAKTHRGKDCILIKPSGEEVTVNNLTAFCRDNGLNHDNIRHGYYSKGWIKKGYKRRSYSL